MVNCKICGKELKAITWKHLKFKHNTLVVDYLDKYPNSICSWNSYLINDERCHEQALKSWRTKRKNGTDVPWNKNTKGLQVAWNIGLKKETDDRVLSISNHLIGNKNSVGHILTNDSRNKIRIKAIDQWKDKNKRRNTINGIRKVILSGEYTPQNNAFRGLGYRKDLNQFFRSRWEANFTRILNYFKIKWEYETHRFDLDDSIYIPDFYLPLYDIYIEVQGFTRKSKIDKLKKLVEKYPEINLLILDSKGYCDLEKIFSSVIPTWEKGGDVK